VRVGDDGEPEHAGETAGVGLPLLGEGEHRLDQRFERERRPNLAEEACGAVTRIAEAMGRTRRDDDGLARSRLHDVTVEAQLEQAVQDVEALGLAGCTCAAATKPRGSTNVSNRT
jgi:hypothetical protein